MILDPQPRRPTGPPGRRVAGSSRRRPAAVRLAAIVVAWAAATGAGAAGETRVIHALLDPEGLPALHNSERDGKPFMWLPQLRLFDGAGRPLWSLSLSAPIAPKRFQRQLEARIAAAEPLAEGRTLGQEARYFRRRGGLPLNVTTLPATDLTVVEYWADDCGLCSRLSGQVDRFFARHDEASVKIIRVFVDLGGDPRAR